MASRITVRPFGVVLVTTLLTFAPVSTSVAQKVKVLFTLRGHGERVSGLAFSPDGKWLTSASHDNRVKVWDTKTGKEILTFKGHTGIASVTGVAFSPDAKWIASASYDTTVKLWAPKTGKVSLTLKHPDLLYGVAVSPDGKRLASGSCDKRVRVWDTATGKKLFTLKGHFFGVNSLAFSPDGKRLASGANNDIWIKLWDPAKGKQLLTLKLDRKYSEGANCLTFSPDGKQLASSDYMGPVTVWDVATGKAQLLLKGNAKTDDYFICATFRPKGKLLASAGGTFERDKSGIIVLWDAATWKAKRRLEAHKSDIYSIAFSPDGKRLASGDFNGTIILWDVSDESK